jgi:hypothetical protein
VIHLLLQLMAMIPLLIIMAEKGSLFFLKLLDINCRHSDRCGCSEVGSIVAMVLKHHYIK